MEGVGKRLILWGFQVTLNCLLIKLSGGGYPLFYEYGTLAQVVEHLTFNQVVWGSNPQCLITCRLFNGHSLKSLFFCCFGVYHGGNGGVGSGGRDIKCLYRLWEPPSAALDLGSCIIFVMVYGKQQYSVL